MRRSQGSRRPSSRHLLAALGAFLVAGLAIVFVPRGAAAIPWAVILGGGVVAGALAEASVWLAPRRAWRERVRFTAWIVPSFLLVATLALLQLLATSGVVIGLAATCAALLLYGVVLLLQDQQVARGPGSGSARFGLSIVGYGIAFALFASLRQYQLHPLLALFAGGGVAAALALATLRVHGESASRPRLQALAVGVGVGLVAAGAAYWSAPALVVGAMLLLVFYVLVGLAESELEGSLDRRVILEYAIVAAIGMTLVLLTTPWRA